MSMHRSAFVLIALIVLPLISPTQNVFEATRIDKPIVVDGRLDEEVWQKAIPLTGFRQIEPYNLRPERFSTVVKVLYDDLGIYVGAQINDPYPDSLILELRKRDDFGLADAFGVKIDPFCDGQNAFGFFVTVRGVQIDSKTNANNEEDFGWDAVWKSAVSLDPNTGWSAELMIPYSALRFSKSEFQQWNINFFRSIQRYREISSWHPIDANIKSQNSQMGRVILSSSITPPLRISATPYLTAGGTYDAILKKHFANYNAGMDVKIGLSESFTVDMTLIPDFGQVESDQYVYSLSPFEVYYEDKRPFFTEGTELFEKGNIFYSRRIGGKPKNYEQVKRIYHPDSVLNNPDRVQLINATKLTGKTSGNLAVGIFNAVTAPARATLIGSSGGYEEVTTEPGTNYNMIVLEQTMAYNSKVSFFNTHVWRPEWSESVFVTGSQAALRNKLNSLEWFGMASVSHNSFSDKPEPAGARYLTSLGKINGRFRPNIWLNLVSDRFDPNEMGYLRSNNELNSGIELNYNEFEPKGHILKWFARARFHQNYQYRPLAFISTYVQLDGRLTLDNHLSIGAYFSSTPFGKHDFYEARRPGLVFYRPAEFSFGFWGSPDYRKRFMAGYGFNIGITPQWNYNLINFRLSPRWRINERSFVVPGVSFETQHNSYGFVRHFRCADSIKVIFGRRDVTNITTSVAFDYAFSPNTSLMLRMRHYSIQVDYHDYLTLSQDGNLGPSDYNAQEDFAVNNLNIDLLFQWNFSPGSQLMLIWKQAVNNHVIGQEAVQNYFAHVSDLWNTAGLSSLNFKLLYYIDWQQIKSFRSKKA